MDLKSPNAEYVTTAPNAPKRFGGPSDSDQSGPNLMDRDGQQWLGIKAILSVLFIV